MEIKKKYIKLFETLDVENWDEIYYGIMSEKLNLDDSKFEHLLDEIFYNLIHWLTEYKGNLTILKYYFWDKGNLKLDNLRHIEGNLGIHESDVISLKNLEYVGGILDIRHNKLTELPSLKYIGGNILIYESGITKEYLLNKPDLIIKGNIVT